jgi:hypothetical protein
MLKQKESAMKELKAYVDQKNRWNAIFKGQQYEIQTAKGRREVAAELDIELSPENLSCDGELPRGQAQAKYRRLSQAAEQLMALDPSIKIWELSY